MARAGYDGAWRLLGCLLHKAGLCLVLVMLRRNDLDFGAAGTPLTKFAQLKTFLQLGCGHVLDDFRRVLRYFMLGKCSAVVMLPRLVRCEECCGIIILDGMGMGWKVPCPF